MMETQLIQQGILNHKEKEKEYVTDLQKKNFKLR